MEESKDLPKSKHREKRENLRKTGDRGQWFSKAEYVLVVAGSIVGLGNVWRFPYLCYRNGGGRLEVWTWFNWFVCLKKKYFDFSLHSEYISCLWITGAFLVPYGLLAVVCGIPLFLLETSVGQFTQEGFITCWTKLCPLAQGEMVNKKTLKSSKKEKIFHFRNIEYSS